MAELLIGGAPVVTLHAPAPLDRPGIVEATVLPGRGLMLLQAVVARPNGERMALLYAPPLPEAARRLKGGPDDFAGNQSFAFGAAILAPYANRIRGRLLPAERQIETSIGGRTVRLPRNWSGIAAGAEAYAMHGLILDRQTDYVCIDSTMVEGRMTGFAGGWPGELELTLTWTLLGGGISLCVEARSVGLEPAPFAAGWHPYFRLPSGDRRQVRLTVPARSRVEVNNYDEVLPTGRLLGVANTPYDFRTGRELGEIYLDDCFTDLPEGQLKIELIDPAGDFAVRIATHAPPVRAVQFYAPLEAAFVVIEPQFNLADPFGSAWPEGLETGMAWLLPGQVATYHVAVDVVSSAESSRCC